MSAPEKAESEAFAAFSDDLMWALDADEEDRQAVRDGRRIPPGNKRGAS